ncbi:MAG: fatty acid desaturase [Phycisphaerae bacterium]|nr:fatty acid desaturase [Phycisphaerae bacterium]
MRSREPGGVVRPLALPATVVAPPPSTGRARVRWGYSLSIVGVHALSLLALWGWFFSWTGLVACVLGLYVFGTLGINIGFHRLLTHRSFACPRWVERTLAILGVCSLEEGPGRWVAIHRQHHQHSDEQPDPHSPLVAFLWGHVGWLLVNNSATDTMHLYQRYSRDLMSQAFYLKLERRLAWMWVYIAHAAALAGVTALIAWAATGNAALAGRLAASMVVWGVLVRTVLVWHITWSVNSLSHLFGYQSHDTGENSRNNWLVALISNGEGWHNNHHADPRSAAHGHRWFELDVSYLTIVVMEKMGLAWKVMRHDRRGAALE